MSVEPLVSVLTPVYNGESYLSECIESVLHQSYSHWEYVIVNNCSTDASFEIASRYAARDPRIRVVTNERFVGVIENHNIAFGHLSPESKYCKVVSADDWLLPECLERMVRLAEDHPSAAVVGCYAVHNVGSKHVGVPAGRSLFPGREVCRLQLLGGPQVLGAPTRSLYRSDVVRERADFFPGSAPRADISACYRTLVNHDFAFVHQVLVFERIHRASLTTEQTQLSAFPLDRVCSLVEFGPFFLSQEEFEQRLNEVLEDYYYDALAPAVLKRYGRSFWDYHAKGLAEIGLRIDRTRLVKAVAYAVIDLLLNPLRTMERLIESPRAARLSELRSRSTADGYYKKWGSFLVSDDEAR